MITKKGSVCFFHISWQSRGGLSYRRIILSNQQSAVMLFYVLSIRRTDVVGQISGQKNHSDNSIQKEKIGPP